MKNDKEYVTVTIYGHGHGHGHRYNHLLGSTGYERTTQTNEVAQVRTSCWPEICLNGASRSAPALFGYALLSALFSFRRRRR